MRAAWITFLLRDISIHIHQPSVLFCDNLSALQISKNLVFHVRTKQIELDYYFSRKKVALNSLITCYIPTFKQLADILPKPFNNRTKTNKKNLEVQAVLTFSLRTDVNNIQSQHHECNANPLLRLNTKLQWVVIIDHSHSFIAILNQLNSMLLLFIFGKFPLLENDTNWPHNHSDNSWIISLYSSFHGNYTMLSYSCLDLCPKALLIMTLLNETFSLVCFWLLRPNWSFWILSRRVSHLSFFLLWWMDSWRFIFLGSGGPGGWGREILCLSISLWW